MSISPDLMSFVPKRRSSVTLLVVLISALLAGGLRAQRDAPVWECYLPRFSVYRDAAKEIVTDFAVRKNGGPIEHTEQQCYVLAVLASQEAELLKLVADQKIREKKAEKSFLTVLQEKKLAVVVATSVSKRTPEFPDESGKPQVKGEQTAEPWTFPFKYTLKVTELFEAVGKLAGFSAERVETWGAGSTHFLDFFKLYVYVPVNDSKDADKVSPEIRKARDFANGMDTWTGVLYFRALPYVFEFSRTTDQKMLVWIN